MQEQLSIDSYENSDLDLYVNNFEQSQSDNESEEDIQNIATLSFSDLAVSATDWTVDTLINQIKKGNIQLDPSFQRRDAWNNKVKSRFVESLFLGLPIPQIILAEQKEKKGKFIVIDGKQRLLSLKQFASPDSDEMPLKLSGLEIFSKFNRMTYEDITSCMYYDDIDAFNNQTIRTVVIKNWKHVEILYLLFLRLNTGSVKLSPQELRQALYPGKFIDYINSAAVKNDSLKRMLNIKKADFRMRDVEILIRYFAFYFYSYLYAGSMQNFLDMTCDKLNKEFDEHQIETAMKDFCNAVNLTFDVFSDKNAFKKYKKGKYEDKYNRAVIDIMLFYFSQVKQSDIILSHKEQIRAYFEEICSTDDNFLSALESTTKSLSAVHYRFKKWGVGLSSITGIDFLLPEGY